MPLTLCEKMAVGFTIETPEEVSGIWTGNWAEIKPNDPNDAGDFHDHLLQHYLLPFFHADGQFVDMFDGGAFTGDALRELIKNIGIGIASLGAAGDDWPGWTCDEIESYYARGSDWGFELMPPKQQAIAEMSRALELANRALGEGNYLMFRGD